MRSSARVLVAVLSMLLVGIPSLADSAEWDQSAVTKIAQQLADVAGDLRRSVRNAPPMQARTQRRARFQALDQLRVAENSINSLARQLAAGGGREETYPTFKRIQMLRNDVASMAQRAHLTEPTLSKLGQAAVLLTKLEPFYAPEEEEQAAE